MAKKDFTFRGKTPEELSKLTVEEFGRLCTSRARRTLKRVATQKYFQKLLGKARKAKQAVSAGKQVKPIRTHYRDTIIVPDMVGVMFAVHKGYKEWVQLEVKEKMLGHYLGEYALTRKRLVHGKAGIGATRSSTAITER